MDVESRSDTPTIERAFCRLPDPTTATSSIGSSHLPPVFRTVSAKACAKPARVRNGPVAQQPAALGPSLSEADCRADTRPVGIQLMDARR